MTPKKTFLTLLLIIILALAFRLPAILNSGSFWFDEIVSLEIAKHNIIDSWQYLKWENNPPLHYWFLHFWIKVFNISEISLRLSSLLFGILNIIVIYFLGKKLFNKNTGIIASFLLAISSFQLFLSMDARMYPMLLFFSILSCYYFWQLIYQSSKKNWLLYVVFTLLAFYTHITAFFLFIIQNLYFIYHYNFINKSSITLSEKMISDKKPFILKWVISQLIILIIFSPWLINFIIKSVSTINSSAWYLNTGSKSFFFFDMTYSFLFFAGKFPFIELIAFAIMEILFLFAFINIYSWSITNKEFKTKLIITPATIFALLLFIIPLLLGFLIQLWVVKYYIVSIIGLFLLIACGLNNLQVEWKIKKLIIFLLLVFAISYNLNVIQLNRHTWDQVAQYVDATATVDDKILISAFVYELPFLYYYQGDVEVVAFQPAGLEENLLLKAVKYNWYSVLTKENMPAMEQFIGNKKRIIIINPSRVSSIHNSNFVVDWFVDNNWSLIHKEQFSGFIQPTVLIFERPN